MKNSVLDLNTLKKYLEKDSQIKFHKVTILLDIEKNLLILYLKCLRIEVFINTESLYVIVPKIIFDGDITLIPEKNIYWHQTNRLNYVANIIVNMIASYNKLNM